MRKLLNIAAIMSCILFLVGNITFDLLDDESLWRVFYIPQSLMIFALISVARYNSLMQGRFIQAAWLFFWYLSIGQVIKFLLFDPFLRTINDYIYPVLILIYVIHQSVKTRK